MPKVFLADALVARGAAGARPLAALLRELADVLREFKAIFARVSRGVDRAVFYDVYRPLLSGSWDTPLKYEGPDGAVLEIPRARGPSAGQTTLFVLIDLALGVRDGAQRGTPLGIDVRSLLVVL